MGLEDFKKVSSIEDVKKMSKHDEKLIDEIFDLKTVSYYSSNIDELISCVEKSYHEYINAKLKFEFRKDTLQTGINWNEENALRESNNLPKVTTQTQRDSVVNLKIKDLKINMESCEMKYKMYNKIFNFITNNFDLVHDYCCNCENEDKICNCDEEK